MHEGGAGRKEEKVRYQELGSAALAVKRWVVREGRAEKPLVVSKTTFWINVRLNGLTLPGQTHVPRIVGRVKRMPEEVAVESGMVLPEDVNASLVFLRADFRIGTGLLKRRRKGDELCVRVCNTDRLFEGLDRPVRVKRRCLGRGDVCRSPGPEEQQPEQQARDWEPNGCAEAVHGKLIFYYLGKDTSIP
jgi:hypothetical protein